MKITHLLCCGLLLSSAGVFANPLEQAEKAVNASVGASTNASASVGHALAATGQLTSGVLAVPVLAVGALAAGVGGASVQAGGALMEASTIGKPLPIASETISIAPPNKALENKPNN